MNKRFSQAPPPFTQQYVLVCVYMRDIMDASQLKRGQRDTPAKNPSRVSVRARKTFWIHTWIWGIMDASWGAAAASSGVAAMRAASCSWLICCPSLKLPSASIAFCSRLPVCLTIACKSGGRSVKSAPCQSISGRSVVGGV